MKRVFITVIVLILILGVSPAVFADSAEYYWDSATDCDYYVYVTTPDGGLNLRQEPSVDAEKSMEGRIPDFVRLHIIEQTDNNWGYTTYDGYWGWVALSQTSGSYPTSDADYDVKVAAPDGGVNLRSGPHQSYGLLVSMISNGNVLHISMTTSNNWGYTTYNGISGWIALSQTEKYTAVSNSTSDDGEAGAIADDSTETDSEDLDRSEEDQQGATAETKDNGQESQTDNGSISVSLPVIIATGAVILIAAIGVSIILVVMLRKKRNLQ